MDMRQTLGAAVRRLAANSKGNVALVSALVAVPLLATTGFALDYAQSQNLKADLQAYADSAVLAGVAQPANFGTLTASQQIAQAKSNADTYFQAILKKWPNSGITDTVQAAVVGGQISISINYYAHFNTGLSQIIGISLINISGTSSGLSAKPNYVDVYALVDASGSMGIGAEAPDQIAMQGALGCTLACHSDGETQVQAAHNAGATLRFDVVKNVISTLIAGSQQKLLIPNQFRFSVIKFSNSITTVSPITEPPMNVATDVANMELDSPPGMGTNPYYSIKQFAAQLPQSGDGSSPSSPLIYVMIMTDGVSDDVDEQVNPDGSWTGHWDKDPNYHVFQPQVVDPVHQDLSGNGQIFAGFDGSVCDLLKAKKATVMTLDLDYIIPDVTNVTAAQPEYRYVLIRDNLKPNITNNLASCASVPTYAYSANSAGDIQTAITEMFIAATQSARISK